jgi:hypothetical protein
MALSCNYHYDSACSTCKLNTRYFVLPRCIFCAPALSHVDTDVVVGVVVVAAVWSVVLWRVTWSHFVLTRLPELQEHSLRGGHFNCCLLR